MFDRRRALRATGGVPRGALAAITALALVGTTASTGEAAELDAARARDKWQLLTPNNTGIPGDYVYSVALDAKDKVWVTADDPFWDEGGIGQQQRRSWKQWTNVDGTAPTHEMRKLTIDDDGTKWAASRVGLLRLDGKKVRTVWSSANAPWPIDIVRDFDWDSEGNLWVALGGDPTTVRGGVGRYDGTSWKVWTTADGLPWPQPWDEVNSLAIDDEDRVWIGSPHLGGAVYDGSEWTDLAGPPRVYDIAIGPDGTPWYADLAAGVYTWDGDAWTRRTGPWSDAGVSTITVDREDRVWVGKFDGTIWRWGGSGSSWDRVHEPDGLGHVYGLAFDADNRPYVSGIGGLSVLRDDGTWAVSSTRNTALPSRFQESTMIDRNGDLWAATRTGGVGEYDGKRWRDFNPENWGTEPWPFATDGVTWVDEAPDGTIWVAPASQGVGAWDGHEWVEHLPSASIDSLAVGLDGRVWAMPQRGPVRVWNGTSWLPLANPPTVDNYEITVDVHGVVWMATAIGLMRYDGTSWKTFNAAHGLPSSKVWSVLPDPSGDGIWVGTAAGLARFEGTAATDVYTKADGLPADVVLSIAVAPDGDVWIGTWQGEHAPYEGGVGHFDGDSWSSYTRDTSPLPHNQVQSITVGPDGRVWIGMASEGVVVLTPR